MSKAISTSVYVMVSILKSVFNVALYYLPGSGAGSLVRLGLGLSTETARVTAAASLQPANPLGGVDAFFRSQPAPTTRQVFVQLSVGPPVPSLRE